MFSEFKKFIMRGNVMDLAIGVIIGAAFGRIVTSLVTDVLMPVIGLVAGKIDFSGLFINLKPGTTVATLAEAKAAKVPVLAYGLFLNTVIEFLIVAFVIFIIVKQVNRFSKPAPSRRHAPTSRCRMAAIIAARSASSRRYAAAAGR